MAELPWKRVDTCTGHLNQCFEHFIHRFCSTVISFNFYGHSRIEIMIYNFLEV